MFDVEFLYGFLVVAMVNLLLIAGTVTVIAKTLARQRAARNAYRIKLARWARATAEGTPAG